MKKPVAVSWSSGKDSALGLERLRHSEEFEVVALFTTFEESTEFLPIQGVPLFAVREQAFCLNLPLVEIPLPSQCPNEIYEKRVIESLSKHLKGVHHLAFGDLYLDGIREYRESFLKPAGFHLHFPLMGKDPAGMAQEILSSGIQARLCSVDRTQLDERFCGRKYDQTLLLDLPQEVDPCGERGEFHTFVYNSPSFSEVARVQFDGTFKDERWTYLKIERSY